HTICFNGSKSFQCFKKFNKTLLSRKDIAFCQMPSTSPANARWKLDMLEAAWRIPLSGCNH
ncbi:MAG: DNA-deoxyinosine glycosylase, partial [Selenomonadaceae bacterium]|nr:DNA-deoxyinosine glycosylase [Selenomonadaceae bacterium]